MHVSKVYLDLVAFVGSSPVRWVGRWIGHGYAGYLRRAFLKKT